MREHDKGKSVGKMKKNRKSCERKGKQEEEKERREKEKQEEIIKDQKRHHEREGGKEHRQLTVGIREEVQAEERKMVCLVQQCKKGGQQ